MTKVINDLKTILLILRLNLVCMANASRSTSHVSQSYKALIDEFTPSNNQKKIIVCGSHKGTNFSVLCVYYFVFLMNYTKTDYMF